MEISVEKLSKLYCHHTILEDVNLKFSEGRVYGVVGENGAGKSTLFQIIAGIEKPTKGVVRFNDLEPDMVLRQKMTYMHQHPYMMKTTVEKNILYPLKIRKQLHQESLEKSYILMEALDIYGLRDKEANKLSGGEKQKVALARALVFEPEVLLMDEPSAHIDRRTMAVIEKMIEDRQKNPLMTTAIITHDEKYFKDLFQEILCVENKGVYTI